MSEHGNPQFLTLGETRIAYHHSEGENPGVFWLGGFMSDMTGGKASELHRHADAEGWQFTRFDYGGHGQSSGKFEDGTIGLWLAHALAMFDTITTGKQVLVGSSMGGWMMLQLALARPERVAGLVGIASAPDFTEDLIWNAFTDVQHEEMRGNNRVMVKNCVPGEADYPITRQLVEEGRNHLLMQKPTLPITCPVHLIHGMQDPDVPYTLSLKIAEKLAREDVTVSLVKNGDHRMSTPDNLALLKQAVGDIRARQH